MNNEQNSADFRVGDVCVLVGLVDYPECNGQEVVIVAPIEWVTCRCPRTGVITEGPHYLASDDFYYRPENLRKKHPPQNLSTWHELQKVCGWKPQDVSV